MDNKQQTLIEARGKLLDAVQQGYRAVELAEVKDGDEPLVTLSWYADSEPESFVVIDIRRDISDDAPIGRARTLDEAVDLLHQVAGNIDIGQHILGGVPIMEIHPKPDPVYGHTFKLDADLLDVWSGKLTPEEYSRRQEARRIDREGGHYRGSDVPGGV